MRAAPAHTVFLQVERCNYARATTAPFDLLSCRPLEREHHSANLSHDVRLTFGTNHTGSLHEACAFHLTPMKLHRDCVDSGACLNAIQDCMGADFRDFLLSCPQTCAGCGMCIDHNSACQRWSAVGHCFSNPGFMLEQCPHSCIKACSVTYDPHPPYFVSLWNGLLMPTIGFGTAGLSIGTADAVLTALDAGYRFDLLPAAGDVATVFMLFHCSSSFVVKCIHSAG